MARRIAVIGLLVVYGAQAWWCARAQSPTFDEVQHVPAGHRMWTTGRFDHGMEQVPLARLWMALPLLDLPLRTPETKSDIPISEVRRSRWMIGNAFDYGHRFLYVSNPAQAETIVLRARAMIILLGIVLGWLISRAASDLGGPAGGLLALGLYAFCPGFVAHGAVATTDVAISLAIVGTLLAAERFRVSASRLWAAVTGLALGAALATQHTAIVLPAILALAWAWAAVRREAASRRGWPLLIATAWLTLCAAYGFREPLTHHEIDRGELAAFVPGAALDQAAARVYRHAPLPDFYMRSLLFNLRHARQGEPMSVAGRYGAHAPWWYVPMVLGVKLPVLILALLLATAASFLAARPAPRERIWLVAGVVLLAAAAAARLALGLRALLPVVAVGLVLAGRLGPSLAAWLAKRPRRVWALVLVGTAHLVSVLGTLPHSLAYANELAGGPARLTSSPPNSQGSRSLLSFPLARIAHAFAVYDLTDDPDLLRFAEKLRRPGRPSLM